MKKSLHAGAVAAVVALGARVAFGQSAPAPGYAAPAPGYAAPAPGYAAPAQSTSGYTAPYAPTVSNERSGSEISLLYVTAVAYGVGLGIWLDAEIGVKDPAAFLIAPSVLGVAAPVGVYVADRPAMRRGQAAAITAGAVIGAGEGIGLSSLQFVSANQRDAWGFRGLARAMTLGATLGAAGGAAFGYLDRPSPRSSVLLTSSVVWGSSIGAMFGYGATAKNEGYGRANDQAALGGFIGYNVALVAAGALSTVYIPTTTTLQWMWAGAGIGFAASLPVYLLYAGQSETPAKRGLLFSATAVTLGLAAGGLLTSGSSESAEIERAPALAKVTGVAPLAAPGAMGLSVVGEVF